MAPFKRIWHWIPPVTFVFLLVGTTTYAFLGRFDASAALGIKILYHAALAVCFLCLWITLDRAIQRSSPAPVQVFWQVLVATLATLILGFLVFQIQGNFSDFNVPAAQIVHVKSALLGTLFTALGFILAQRFGYLARFRRTRRSERNWHLFMLSVSLAFVTFAPLHHHFNLDSASPEGALISFGIMALATLAVIVFLFLNAVRLGWIVRLSFRQKMAAIGLGIILTCLTAGTLLLLLRPDVVWGATQDLSYPSHFLLFYSLPLWGVTILFLAFGFIYSLISVLSLIFHLPTIGDYQRSTDEMVAMQALAVLVREVADTQRLHHWIVSTPVDAGRGKSTWLTVQGLETGSLRPQIAATCNISTDLVNEACDWVKIHQQASGTRKLVYIQNTAADRRTQKGRSSDIMSLLAIPLVTSSEVLGTLFVTREVAKAFEKDDIESVGIFASQATLVLENARLLEAKIESERLAGELAIAREVQQRLLPQTMPQLPNLSLAASSTPALEVGGDYYDLLEFGEAKLAFIVADVSGKGISAAFYMAEMQGIFQAVTRISPEPNDFLYHANRALGESLEKNVFVTAIYGIIDCNSGHMSIARAGHSPAVLVDVGGNAKLLRSDGLGIGLDRSELFSETLEVEQLVFAPGDLIVLYTDGVVESRNPDGEEFGYERLLQSIRTARYERAQGVHDAVRNTVDRFLGPEKNYDDDLTLLAIKWHGQEPVVHDTEQGILS